MKKHKIVKTFFFLCAVTGMLLASMYQTPVNAQEITIGSTNVGSWNGGSFYEYLTYELTSYNNDTDIGTYRIRYYLTHTGGGYTLQTAPVALSVDGRHITTFSSGVGIKFSNETRCLGSYSVNVSAGAEHTFGLADTEGGSITQVNMSKKIYLPYPSFTVNYKDYNNTVLKMQSVTKYSNAAAPANPSRIGYTFTGWSSDGKNIRGDTDIIAQYRINTYSIAFNSMGGSAIGPQTVQYQGKVSKPADPTRSGYKFMGWYTNTTYMNAYNFDSVIGASGFTLYAKWDRNPVITSQDSFTFYENELSQDVWNARRKSGLSASDLEDGDLTGKVSITDNVNLRTAGTYKVNYQVTDSVGSVVKKEVPVTVKFNNPPALSTIRKSYYENEIDQKTWEDTLRMQNISATDIEDGTITGQIELISDNADLKKPGTYQVRYRIVDQWGKSSEADAEVEIKYNNPPVFHTVKKTYYENEIDRKTWEKTLRMQNITADDIEDGNLTSHIEMTADNVDLENAGTYQVRYRVIDQWGKYAETETGVEIKYNNPPVITASDKSITEGQYTKESWEQNALRKDVSAADQEDGDLTTSIEVVRDEVDPTTPGWYRVTYAVTDQWDKTTEKTIKVEVKYNAVPVIDVENMVFHEGEFGDEWLEELLRTMTSQDAEDGDLTEEVEIVYNNVDPQKPGTYEVTFKVTDSLGKTTTKTIDVTVQENHTPTLQIFAESKRFIEGEYTQNQWESIRMQDVTAHDYEDNDLTDQVIIKKDTTKPDHHGKYELTYQVTDQWGKSTEKKVNVTVEENKAPEIMANDKWFTTFDTITEEKLLKNITAMDDHDGYITDRVTIISNEVKQGTAGEYEVTYQVKDRIGKKNEKTIVVHITEPVGEPAPPIPPAVTDPEALQLWNGRDLGGINITKLMEDSIFHQEGYKDITFGIFAAEDIVYKDQVILNAGSLIAITKPDENGQLYAKLYHKGKYYVQELSTDSDYKLDQKKYIFTVK